MYPSESLEQWYNSFLIFSGYHVMNKIYNGAHELFFEARIRNIQMKTLH